MRCYWSGLGTDLAARYSRNALLHSLLTLRIRKHFGTNMFAAIQKLVRANPQAKTRLHDLSGSRASMPRIVRNLPRAVVSRFMFSTFGTHPSRPWFSYDVASLLEKKLNSKPCSVLEFGSGSSTAWLAARAKTLYSVEHNPDWYEIVSRRLQNSSNVIYEVQTSIDEYSQFARGARPAFDVIIIDGIWRLACVEHNLDLLAADGLLYFDNSDADSSTGEPGEVVRAVDKLRAFATENGWTLSTYTDFAPTVLYATQGLLLTPPAE